MRFPEQFRVTEKWIHSQTFHRIYALNLLPFATSPNQNGGHFCIPAEGLSQLKETYGWFYHVIARSEMNWEYLSAETVWRQVPPTRNEMNYLAGLFWQQDEIVLEFYHVYESPKEDLYRRHLWRPIDGIFPRPNPILVGYPNAVRKCRVCSCTDNDCSQCIEMTGVPCHWVDEDLCSACSETNSAKKNNK